MTWDRSSARDEGVGEEGFESLGKPVSWIADFVQAGEDAEE